jgi:hypothetical protein
MGSDNSPERSAWAGLVVERHDDFQALQIVMPVAPAGGSWSGPFRVTASDNRDYFVKSLDVCPPGQGASLVIEQVVAKVGELIGAPVCHTSLIRIPDEIAGWEPRPGVALKAGLAHASLALEHADEMGRPQLFARGQDDNRRRHVGVYALFDWCCGTDAQWLYDLDSDRMLYSHDHGLYLPPVGSGILTDEDMVIEVDRPYELPDPRSGLLPSAIDEMASAVEAVTRDDLASILNQIPKSWPVTDQVLETLGWFLERRAPAVGLRLRAFHQQQQQVGGQQ